MKRVKTRSAAANLHTSREGESGQSVHNEVDPQELDRRERCRASDGGTAEWREQKSQTTMWSDRQRQLKQATAVRAITNSIATNTCGQLSRQRHSSQIKHRLDSYRYRRTSNREQPEAYLVKAMIRAPTFTVSWNCTNLEMAS